MLSIKNNFYTLVFSIVILALGIFSCTSNESNISEKSIDNLAQNGGWKYQDSLILQVNALKNHKSPSLQLELTHGEDFPFSNTYIKLDKFWPDLTITSDTIEIALVDENKYWIGDINGNKIKVSTLLNQPTLFTSNGTFRICITQFSRADSLKGVHSIKAIMFDPK